MGYVIRMPQLGMSMDEGTVVEWSTDEGGEVAEGSVVAVVESEKATHEVEAREEGVVRAILVPEGESVEPGTPIGVLAGAEEDLATYADEVGTDLDGGTGTVGGESEGGDVADGDAGEPVAASADAGAEARGESSARSTGDASEDVRATPGARRLGDSEGVDLGEVEGTGPQGVVTEDDVGAYLESAERAGDDVGGEPGGAASGGVAGGGTAGGGTAGGGAAGGGAAGGGAIRTVAEARSLSGIQKAVSERLSKSYANAVHVTLNRTFDAGALTAVTAAADADEGRERDGDRDGNGGAADVSITDLLVKGVADALATFPEFNALFEDGEHRLIEEVNVGVAVDVEDGLVTPVIPAVDEKSAEAVHRTRTSLADRVLSGEFTMDDLSGGTFTVSNLGPYGVDDFDPVINPPEVAILGAGRIRDDGTMTLSLSFDHRVVNGADAARFLDALVGTLTDERALVAFFESDLDVSGGDGLDDREVHVENTEGFGGRYRTACGDVAFDEPESVGGSGSAPSPVDHLLGAVGSCLSLSVRALAERDDVEVGAIATSVEGSPAHGALEAIDVQLEIESDADEEALGTVVTKAERACYVARSLSDDLRVDVGWTRR